MYKSLTIWQMCLHVFPPVLLCFSWICNVLWDHLRETFQECFEFITFHYSNCCIFRVKTVRNNSEIDRNKSAQHKVKSWYYKWLLLITRNPTNFSSTHGRICVKDATPLKVFVNSLICITFSESAIAPVISFVWLIFENINFHLSLVQVML